jgi:hypothetical protein
MRREMSDVNVNEDPNAGLIDVAENRERGLVGTLVAWALITYPQPLILGTLKDKGAHESCKPICIGQFGNIFHYPHHCRLTYLQHYLEKENIPAEFVLIN